MTKMQYEDAYASLNPTMELKRNNILGYLTCLVEADRDCHGKLSYHGYFRTDMLKREICLTMGWIIDKSASTPFRDKAIQPDLDDPRVAATLKNMEAKGHIRLSKSGKGYKILDTWRRS